jgi:hypothetical protein
MKHWTQVEKIMPIDESDLTKGQIRKLNALRKSIGDSLGEEAFKKWLAQQKTEDKEARPDPVAERILDVVKPLEKDKSLNLGRYGYSIKRARGKGAKGFVVARIEPE